MALAIVRFTGAGGEDYLHFDVELGRNRFYTFAIGDAEVDRTLGFAVLANRSFVSPLVGPVPDHPVGRTALAIPAAQFDREHQYLQLTSYRTHTLTGPAISEVVRVPIGATRGGDFPPIDFGMGTDMGTSTHVALGRGPVAFAYSESQPLSEAKFFGALLPILQNVLPTVGKLLPVVGQVVGAIGGGGGGGAGGTAAPAAPVLQTLTQPDTMKLIQQLIEQVAAIAKGGTATAKALGVTPRVAHTNGNRRANGRKRSSGTRAVRMPAHARAVARTRGPYSEAAIAPALLAALPALMPLLEKALNPETLKALFENLGPQKLIGAVTDSVKEIGKLGLDIDKQSNEHLRALNPMGVHGAVDSLLEGMSVARGGSNGEASGHASRGRGTVDPTPLYRRVDSVTLTFADLTPLMIHGRTRLCYRQDADIAFPLSVETPRTISDARLVLLVKDPATRKVLLERRLPVSEVTAGRLAVSPTLTRAQLERLQPNEDYLVCAYLLWRDKSKKVIGTSRSQLITVVGEFTFDRVEEAGDLIPLNDVTKFRSFWHKAWQGSFDADVRRVEFDCKYYFALEPDRTDVAPMETVLREGDARDRVLVGRLKTGLVLAPAALNRLIAQLGGAQPLGEAELGALRSGDFVARFNQGARFKASFHGRSGTTAALWIYPEVKLQNVVLLRIAHANAAGHVQQLDEHVVRFPIPVLIHTIGARTTS